MKFFQTLIASILGVFIALFIIFIIFFVTLASSTQEPEPYVRNNSVLKIDISGNLPARHTKDPFDELFNENSRDVVSLQTLSENLSKAKEHDNIKGVWLEIDFVSGGWANLEEAHRLISAFRDSSEKFVYASTNDLGYNEKGYYVATSADSIFSPPESFFEFDGMYAQVMFYTGLFEKVGIDAEIARHGEYKSSVEPFNRKELSEESRYQLSQLIEDINSSFVEAVSQKTGRSTDEINAMINSTPSLLASRGYENGLIDSLLFPDQVEGLIKQRIGLDADSELNTISNGRYNRVTPQTAGLDRSVGSDKIAVIYADGPITFGLDGTNPFSSQPYITASFFEKQLEDIRADEDVKALVVRINSPGGSGSTSDLIWRRLRETSKDIPVIASMGPVAASGGYYIAMAADSIVAESTTITGSIGVFATKFNTQQLWNEELGITFDEVKSHRYADWLDPTRGFTETERKAYQQFVDDFYQTFIGRVADSRQMTAEQVDEIARGRVWSGSDAREQNLVDLVGGFEKAVEIAAEKAGIEEYSMDIYPRQKDLFQLLMGSAGTKMKALIDDLFPFDNRKAEPLKTLFQNGRGDPMLIFPYELNIQ